MDREQTKVKITEVAACVTVVKRIQNLVLTFFYISCTFNAVLITLVTMSQLAPYIYLHEHRLPDQFTRLVRQ